MQSADDLRRENEALRQRIARTEADLEKLERLRAELLRTRILVVDDNPQTLGYVCDALSSAGYLPPENRLHPGSLESAHEAGVVHRDLKPANVMVQHDGAVKVLDFGLAKARDAVRAPGETDDRSTAPSHETQAGVVVGTAAYMSPEQARGRSVDRRTDIWAFGAVLFEMLTGRRAFEGDDAAGILAEVIKAEPAWEALPDDTTPAVSAVLRRCLEKEPFQRLRDVADVRMGLHGAFEDRERTAAAAPGRRSGWIRRAAAVAAAAVVAGLGVWILQPADSREPVRFAILAWRDAPSASAVLWLDPAGRELPTDGGSPIRPTPPAGARSGCAAIRGQGRPCGSRTTAAPNPCGRVTAAPCSTWMGGP